MPADWEEQRARLALSVGPKLLERFGRPTDGQDLDLACRKLPKVPRPTAQERLHHGRGPGILPVDGSASSSPTVPKVAFVSFSRRTVTVIPNTT
jgi:hypothetical protein